MIIERDAEERIAKLNRLTKIIAYMERLVRDGFYGRITIGFQNGEACDVKIEQTLKPEKL